MAPDAFQGDATVTWSGSLQDGKGALRFELGAGGELPLLWPGGASYGPGATSPEELAAAAHAACFTMTLAHTLARQRRPPRRIETHAEATFGVSADTRQIVRSRLEVTVEAEALTEPELDKAVDVAGRYCPVSNTLRKGGVVLVVEPRVIAG